MDMSSTTNVNAVAIDDESLNAECRILAIVGLVADTIVIHPSIHR